MAYKKLIPPFKGQNKNWSASSQPVLTSPDMNNVRPRSVLDKRAVIGQRPALVKAYATQLGSGNPVVAMCQVSVSNETTKNKYVRKLVAAAGNKIYYENDSNVMTELSGATIDTTEPVVLIEAYQKVFVINGTNLKVIDFVNTKLTTLTGVFSAFADYSGTVAGTVKGTDVGHGLVNGDTITISGTTNYNGTFTITKIGNDNFYFTDTWVADDATGTWVHNLVSLPTRNDILNQVSAAQMVVDFVNSDATEVYGKVISSELFDTANSVTSTGTSTDFTPSAVSTLGVPLWYDWTPYPDIDGGTDEDFGVMPTQATFGTLYRGRIILGGDKDYANQWYAPRQGFPWDWAYFSNEVQSPIASNNSNSLGDIGEIGTALIAYSNNYMVMAGAHTIHVMSGDPIGGSLRQIAFDTGIWSRESWCIDDKGNLYFLGLDGIYMIPNDLSRAINLTKFKLPSFMADWAIDSTLHRVTLTYDPRGHGLLICKTTIASGANENYWFDLRVGDEASPGGFFPESYPNECGIFSGLFYQADDPVFNRILLGCNDGYIRTFDDNAKDDEGTTASVAISSDVLFGPFPISANIDLAAKIVAQTFVTAGGGVGGSQSDTDGITYEIYVADTAEEIIEAVTAATPAPMYAATITGPGKSTKKRHRARGIYAAVRIKNITASQTWAIDRILLEIKPAGKAR